MYKNKSYTEYQNLTRCKAQYHVSESHRYECYVVDIGDSLYCGRWVYSDVYSEEKNSQQQGDVLEYTH